MFELNPVPNTRGVDLAVMDASQNRVYQSHWDAGEPGRADTRVRTPGTYYAVLTASACCGGASYDYGFLVSTSEQADARPLERFSTDCPFFRTPQCAIPLYPGEDDDDTFGRDPIMYSVEVEEPGPLTFTFDPIPTNRGLNVTLLDPGYDRIDRFDFAADEPGTIEFDFEGPGTYYVVLKAGACCGGGSNDYGIAISR